MKDLRSQAKQLQSQLSEVTAEGSAAWDKVKVKVDGNQTVLSVQIDDELLSTKEKLQDAIIEATNSAMKKVQREAAMIMQQNGGFPGFPGM